MAVEIMRVIEAKDANGKWHQVKYYTSKRPKLKWWQKLHNLHIDLYNNTIRKLLRTKWLWSYYSVPDIGPWYNMYTLPKDLWWDYLETNANEGLPEDINTETDKLCREFGTKFYWTTYDKLCTDKKNYKREFCDTVKSLSCYSKLNDVLDILNKVKKPTKATEDTEDEYFYPNYIYDDIDVRDEFDDKFACMLWKYEMLTEDITVIDFICDEICTDIWASDVRVIFIYNG